MEQTLPITLLAIAGSPDRMYVEYTLYRKWLPTSLRKRGWMTDSLPPDKAVRNKVGVCQIESTGWPMKRGRAAVCRALNPKLVHPFFKPINRGALARGFTHGFQQASLQKFFAEAAAVCCGMPALRVKRLLLKAELANR